MRGGKGVKGVKVVKGGESQGVGQLLPDWGPGWMGIRHHRQEAGPPSKWPFFIICKGFDEKFFVHCVNIEYLYVV